MPPPPPPVTDSAGRDTLPAGARPPVPPARDTTPRDTIKAPIALPERPRGPLVEGARSVWDRDAIFASGALTLGELVAQVPGAALHVGSFIAGVTATSWYGEPGRVRVFFDGVEIDVLDPRLAASVDLNTIPLWSMEEVVVERSAGELRVHLRSWRVRRTTAETRTDIVTGTENSNLYRGFYGKRFDGGGVLQVAGQQYSTTSPRTRGDGDALGAFIRVGTARGRFTVDAVASRFGRTRTATRRYVLTATPVEAAIGGFKGRDLTAYLRAAWGDVEADGWWVQGIAATVQHVEDDSIASGAAIPDPDTLVSQGQFVGAVGVNRGPLRLSATARYRTQDGHGRLSPSLRASYERGWLSASGYLEQGGPDSTGRVEAALRLRPVRWLHASGTVSRHRPGNILAGGPERLNVRGEVGLTGRGRAITAGVIRTSQARGVGMEVFDPEFTATTLGTARGYEIGVGGRVFGPFTFEFRALEWAQGGIYRPKNETHAALGVSTDLRRYIPRRTFHLAAALTHDWRSTLEAPDGGGSTIAAQGAGHYGMEVDIRIGSAHIFWYNRNFTGRVYETVPGYLAPRLVQLYGVRWDFWN